MLNKHPDSLNDSQLYEIINSWVRTQTPESLFLDYKRELNFKTQKDKIELAKDISSFANTEGGCLIYGIDEERQGEKSVSIPKGKYGIDPIESNIIDIENTLTSIISPTLPDLRIRQISLVHEPSKVVYFFWHSKSWSAPHMVSGFKHTRYYKRGNFKSEPMQEHEIEFKYRERSATFNHTKDFIDKIDYGIKHIHPSSRFLKIAVAPLYLSIDNKYFQYKDADKLISNSRSGFPLSILDGISYIHVAGRFVVKLYFNGVITICYDITDCLEKPHRNDIDIKVLNVAMLRQYLDRTIMQYIIQYYSNISFRGPIIINIIIDNAQNILLDQINHQYISEDKILKDYIYQQDIYEFSEIFPMNDILMNLNNVINRLLLRLTYGLGGYNFT